MRRRSVFFAAAASLALVLTGCSSTSGSSEKKDSGNATGTIVVWGDETRGKIVEALGKKFEEKYKIKVKFVQKGNDTLISEYKKQVPAGQGPDVIVTAHDHLGEWVKDGVAGTIDITSSKDKFLPVSVQGVTYNGQTYGVPYAIENVALVRNNKLTKVEPKTYDEMIAAGKEANVKYPFIIQSNPQNGDPYHMYPFQTSFGIPVFKSDSKGYTTELAMGGEKGAKFAQWLKSQGEAKIFDNNISGDKAKQEFMEGHAAFTVTGPWNVPDFKKKGLDISVLPVPSAGGEPAAPFVGVQAFFPNPKSKNKVLVNKFLTEFVASEEGQKIAFEIGQRPSAWTSVSESATDPIVKGFGAAGKQGVAMPAIPAMAAVWEHWGSAEANIVKGKVDPAQGWNTMLQNIEKAIAASK